MLVREIRKFNRVCTSFIPFCPTHSSDITRLFPRSNKPVVPLVPTQVAQQEQAITKIQARTRALGAAVDALLPKSNYGPIPFTILIPTLIPRTLIRIWYNHPRLVYAKLTYSFPTHHIIPLPHLHITSYLYLVYPHPHSSPTLSHPTFLINSSL